MKRNTLQKFIQDNWNDKGEFLLVVKSKEDLALDAELLCEGGNKFEMFIRENDITPMDDPMYEIRKILKNHRESEEMERISNEVNHFIENQHILIPAFIKKAHDVLVQKGEEEFMYWLDSDAKFDIYPK